MKTKELMVYVAHRLGNRSNYGATLLNKALYFIDNVHYLRNGIPISEFTYIKQAFGPTPEPALFLSLRDELVNANDLVFVQNDFFGRIQKRLFAGREPRWELFSTDEIATIDKVISEIADYNGSEISELSHQYPAWQVAAEKEELPFHTFLLSFKTPDEHDLAWAKLQIEECSGS
ncbi:Panacea domain-containing protein [Chryseolinea lacunae]|uniref:SocA family protein n=1 Tax=Chryseolinea lacunae TaxID=2801331 RepID=A0ABS1KUT7_9BACT|nr:Panacea domain-containing protein [Chryseolinea lacunae]MBL0743238.1 SocA family protein [Chryseolinea lacunae]